MGAVAPICVLFCLWVEVSEGVDEFALLQQGVEVDKLLWCETMLIDVDRFLCYTLRVWTSIGIGDVDLGVGDIHIAKYDDRLAFL